MGFGIGGRVERVRFEFSDYFVFLEDFSIVGFVVGGGVVFGSC
jgi:hypothetical protein